MFYSFSNSKLALIKSLKSYKKNRNRKSAIFKKEKIYKDKKF